MDWFKFCFIYLSLKIEGGYDRQRSRYQVIKSYYRNSLRHDKFWSSMANDFCFKGFGAKHSFQRSIVKFTACEGITQYLNFFCCVKFSIVPWSIVLLDLPHKVSICFSNCIINSLRTDWMLSQNNWLIAVQIILLKEYTFTILMRTQITTPRQKQTHLFRVNN